ncbi:MAG: hypothetical protein GWO88_00070 [Planctomycetia bacterium]|nr:hypothetical protein [Planctomycetia bacterium]
MDHAVGLVEAYLQINGYFTVAEYPVIESFGKNHYGIATDLDILAFRFPKEYFRVHQITKKIGKVL